MTGGGSGFNGQRYFEETRTLEPPQPMQAEGPLKGMEYFNRHALEVRRFAFVCVVLRCVRRQFLMDKSLDPIWDKAMMKYLAKHSVEYEEV